MDINTILLIKSRIALLNNDTKQLENICNELYELAIKNEIDTNLLHLIYELSLNLKNDLSQHYKSELDKAYASDEIKYEASKKLIKEVLDLYQGDELLYWWHEDKIVESVDHLISLGKYKYCFNIYYYLFYHTPTKKYKIRYLFNYLQLGLRYRELFDFGTIEQMINEIDFSNDKKNFNILYSLIKKVPKKFDKKFELFCNVDIVELEGLIDDVIKNINAGTELQSVLDKGELFEFNYTLSMIIRELSDVIMKTLDINKINDIIEKISEIDADVYFLDSSYEILSKFDYYINEGLALGNKQYALILYNAISLISDDELRNDFPKEALIMIYDFLKKFNFENIEHLKLK